MNYFNLILWICLCFSNLFASTITCKVVDAQTKLPLEYISVRLLDVPTKGTFTNENGDFTFVNITLPSKVVVSNIAYKTDTFKLTKDLEIIHLHFVVNYIPQVEIIIPQKRNPLKYQYKYRYPLNSKPATLSNPLTFIHEKFNKKLREIKKYNSTVNDEIYYDNFRNKIIELNDFLKVKPEDLDGFTYYIVKNDSDYLQKSNLEIMSVFKSKYKKFIIKKSKIIR